MDVGYTNCAVPWSGRGATCSLAESRWTNASPIRPKSISDSRLSGCDISSDHIQVVAGGFERLFGVMVRNKSGVIIKGYIALPAETIKDDQQTGMFLVDARPHKIDDGDVVPRLTSRTESMAEHKPQGSFEHCFVGLLKASFLVKGENFGAEASFLSALVRKRSICAQSTVCGFSFFIWTYERNTLIVPDVFQKGILPSAARPEFLRR